MRPTWEENVQETANANASRMTGDSLLRPDVVVVVSVSQQLSRCEGHIVGELGQWGGEPCIIDASPRAFSVARED